MKLFKFILLSFLILSSAVYANIDANKLKELATSNSENASYLSKDGKIRHSVEYVMTEDGKVEMRAKKQYLPAVTDGINRDKTSKFRIPPSAKKTAKYFAKGANHAMFLSMIIDVLGDGVDYVLDEKNNSIQYTKSQITCSTQGFGNHKANSFEELRSKIYADKSKYFFNSDKIELSQITLESTDVYFVDGRSKLRLGYCVKQQQETKVMNDEEFAQAVIELAKADNAKAKKVVLDVAKQAVSDGDYDKEIQKAVDELNADETKDDTQDNQDNTSDSSNASSSDSTNTDSQDDTQATPKNQNETDNNGGKEKDKLEFPNFCDWATKVCEFIDWVQNDNVEKDKDTELDVDNKDIDIDGIAQRNYINFTAQCPANYVYSMPIMGKDVVIEFRLDILCRLFILMKPFTLIFAYIQALIIVGRDL